MGVKRSRQPQNVKKKATSGPRVNVRSLVDKNSEEQETLPPPPHRATARTRQTPTVGGGGRRGERGKRGICKPRSRARAVAAMCSPPLTPPDLSLMCVGPLIVPDFHPGSLGRPRIHRVRRHGSLLHHHGLSRGSRLLLLGLLPDRL